MENIGTLASLKIYIVLTTLSLCHVSTTEKNLCDILSLSFDIIITHFSIPPTSIKVCTPDECRKFYAICFLNIFYYALAYQKPLGSWLFDKATSAFS